MNSEQIVIDTIKEVLGYSGEITGDMQAVDVDGWDSLSHTTIVMMIERRLGITISEAESNALDTIQDLLDLSSAKVAAKA